MAPLRSERLNALSRDDLNAFLARPQEIRDGISLGVKDLFDTAGLTTTYGSAIFREHIPERTAEAVRRLEQSGYAVVGKTNLHEFAYGITSENEHYGDVVNPLDSGRIARKTFSFSSRSDSLVPPTGGSMARSAVICNMWFWMTSRSAPTSS